MRNVVCYLSFSNAIIQLLAFQQNTIRKCKYPVSLYTLFSQASLKYSWYNLKHHNSCSHNKADYYKFEFLSWSWFMFHCFAILKPFVDIAFYLLCEQWIYRCSQTYTGGVTFAMDMLSTLESFHGKTDKCGFANHASRFNCFYIACAVLMFFTVESFCFCYFVKDHWRDHCKLEEYFDWDHRNQEFARFLFSCLERKLNQWDYVLLPAYAFFSFSQVLL